MNLDRSIFCHLFELDFQIEIECKIRFYKKNNKKLEKLKIMTDFQLKYGHVLNYSEFSLENHCKFLQCNRFECVSFCFSFN